jgi:hypothetical protein
MKSSLPPHQQLPVGPLAGLFAKTSASYKFFWFLAILELVEEEPEQTIPFRELFAQMLAKVWYPVHYFKLSFGKQDKLSEKAKELHAYDPGLFPIELAPEKLVDRLLVHPDKAVERLLFHFQTQVPYRLLTAWLGTDHTNPQIARLSQDYKENCPYRLNLDGEKSITINPAWQEYLFTHKAILQDYTYWNLLLYLQDRNPNVPDIAHKLVKPQERQSLSRHRNLWNLYLAERDGIPCLYTRKPLRKGAYDLDHFIPWSFLPNNQMWNLIPGDSSVNSSKSNHLPDLDFYLPDLASQQQDALRFFLEKSPNSGLLEDYLQLAPELAALADLSPDAFTQRYRETLGPMVQIATNMGFRAGWRWERGSKFTHAED